MKTYTVTCVEQLPSGNWRVKAAIGTPFVLKAKNSPWNSPLVVWLRDPYPGREVKIMVPDWRALRHRQLVGDELYEANRRRLKALRAAGRPKELDRRFRVSRGSLDLHEILMEKYRTGIPENVAVQIAARGKDGGTVALQPHHYDFDCDDGA